MRKTKRLKFSLLCDFTVNYYKKILLALIIPILAYISLFSIKQWLAERAFPVERDFTRISWGGIVPDDNQLKRLKYALKVTPENYRYHILLGKYYIYGHTGLNAEERERRESLKAAESEYLNALILNPSYTDTLAYLAWTEFSLGKTYRALERLEIALKLDPDNYFIHLFYGICLSSFIEHLPKNFRDVYIYRAKVEFKKGLTLNPGLADHPAVIMARTNIFLKEDNLKAAIQQIERIGPVNITTLPYHIKLAGLYIKSGDINKGIRKYRELLTQSGLDIKERKEAIALLKKDVESYPQEIELKILLGEVYFDDKEMGKALEILKDVGQVRPGDADIHYMIGQIYESSGEMNAAYNEYEETLKYSKDHPGASKKIINYYKRKL